jgi:hypothetical protein
LAVNPISGEVMLPKEHGAWNILSVSAAAGWLARGAWDPAALAATLFFLLGFILRAPLGTWRQYRAVDPPRARKALLAFLVGSVLCAASFAAFWVLAPPSALRWMLFGAVPLGLLLGILYLWKRTLRFLAAEVLGFLGLSLLVPVLYLCAPGSEGGKAAWLYSLFAGQGLLALSYVRVRRDWFLAAKRGEPAPMGAARWRRGFWTLQLHALFVLGILGCPHGGGLLAVAPTLSFFRALSGVALGRPDLPIMRLGQGEMVHSLLYMLVALFAWQAV